MMAWLDGYRQRSARMAISHTRINAVLGFADREPSPTPFHKIFAPECNLHEQTKSGGVNVAREAEKTEVFWGTGETEARHRTGC